MSEAVRRAVHLDLLDVLPGDRAMWPEYGSRSVAGEVVEVVHHLAARFDGRLIVTDVSVTVASDHLPTYDACGWPVDAPGTATRRLSRWDWAGGTGVQLYR